MTYERNKIWRDTFTLWNDTVQKSPHKASPYNGRGMAYFNQGRFTQALSDYNKAIEINPTYGEAYYNRGNTYSQQGNFTQALLDYNKAIEINPDSKGYVNLKITYIEQNFTQAVEMNPANADVYINRGIIYGDQGDFTQAISDCNKAIEIDPKNGKAYYTRAVTNYQLKEYGKTWSDVHKSEELGYAVNPDFISILNKTSSKDK